LENIFENFCKAMCMLTLKDIQLFLTSPYSQLRVLAKEISLSCHISLENGYENFCKAACMLTLTDI